MFREQMKILNKINKMIIFVQITVLLTFREQRDKIEHMRVTEFHELQTLEMAIAELRKETGASLKRLSLPAQSEGNPDAYIEIKLKKTHHKFFVEVKREVRLPMIERLISQFGSKKDQWLLVARYIATPAKEFLKGHGYNYLEMTGNCFISTDNLFISINNKEVKHVLKTPEGKLWKPTGLKFLFVILQDPNMLTRTQREIAQAADIALGNISNFLEELRSGEYLVKEQDQEKLKQREILIERWVQAFHIILRPRLKRGTFRFLNTDKQKGWRDVDIPGIYWAGEPGADLYTNYLNPENFSLYTSKPTIDLLKNLRIIPDNKGNVEVLDKFWNEWGNQNNQQYAAPYLLVYAELKNSLDSRNWEVAEKIKNLLLDENKHT